MCSIGDIEADGVAAVVFMATICEHPIPENTPESGIGEEISLPDLSRPLPRTLPNRASPQLSTVRVRSGSRIEAGTFSGAGKQTVDLDQHPPTREVHPCTPPSPPDSNNDSPAATAPADATRSSSRWADASSPRRPTHPPTSSTSAPQPQHRAEPGRRRPHRPLHQTRRRRRHHRRHDRPATDAPRESPAPDAPATSTTTPSTATGQPSLTCSPPSTRPSNRSTATVSRSCSSPTSATDRAQPTQARPGSAPLDGTSPTQHDPRTHHPAARPDDLRVRPPSRHHPEQRRRRRRPRPNRTRPHRRTPSPADRSHRSAGTNSSPTESTNSTTDDDTPGRTRVAVHRTATRLAWLVDHAA